MVTPAPAAPATSAWRSWVPGLCGLVLGLAVVGPGLRPGILLNLDLSATERLRMPPGIWGLGPALTQRVPLGALEAVVSTVIGGPLTAKLLIVATIAVAYAGLERLARPASVLARHGAALAYAAGPYVVTRVAVGHLNVSWAAAVLPWVLPILLRPSLIARRTFVALFLLGLGGTASAIVGLVVVAIGLAVERERRPVAVAGWATLASLPWLMPNAVVLAQGAAIEGAAPFRTALDGALGPFHLLAGGGFWVPANQVGGRDVAAACAGLLLAGLAGLGWNRLPEAWRRPALVVALAGLAVAAASALPGVRSVWSAFAAGPVGAPLREGQRFLMLWLVVALPAAAHGADRLATWVSESFRPTVAAVPLALGFVLAAPGLLGAQGAFETRELPTGWTAAAQRVQAEPGTTLVLPWHQYYTASFADGRTILDPAPDVLGVDTISSFDPEVGGGQEQLDTRPTEALRILERYRRGAAAADDLAELGVRWVFVAKEYDWAGVGLALADDPGLRPIDVGQGALLYEVRAWRGPLRLPTGGSASVPALVAPLRRVPDAGGTWAFPGTGGWRHGTEAVPVTPKGLLEVPPGDGPLWYWPAVPIVTGDVLTAAGVAWVAWTTVTRRRDRGRDRTPTTLTAGRVA